MTTQHCPRQESVFRELKAENTFLILNLTFSFDWNYISFDSLSMYCQTWESKENGFQKNEFLETNGALVLISWKYRIGFKLYPFKKYRLGFKLESVWFCISFCGCVLKKLFLKNIFSWSWFVIYICLDKTVVEIKIK